MSKPKASLKRSLRATARRLRAVVVTVVITVLGATAIGLLGCNAPFIPVPPPDNVFVAETLVDGSGNSKTVWITQGKPDPHAALAKFFIFNDSIGSGVIVDAKPDGSYVAPALDGTLGDRVFLSYTTPNGEDSEVVCRQLVEGDPAPRCP